MTCPYDRDAHQDSRQASKVPETRNEGSHKPIPQPPVHWFTKNIPEIDPTFPSSSIWRLADIYGEIYQLDLVTNTKVVLSTRELINEVLNEEKFEKSVSGGLMEARALAGDGLFTAFPDEPNWGKAHRVLMPVFGPLSIQKMFPDMLDIASQMILRWDRYAGQEIIIADDFTISNPPLIFHPNTYDTHRLAFDTIALCSFSHRFNSYYLQELHPFAIQMAEVLVESGRRATQPSIETQIRVFAAQHNKENIAKMWKVCDDIVAERRAHPDPNSKDLLNAMLTSKDPMTGEYLSDENIRFNMVTFLVAGHETTSGTLAFMWYHLLKNPETYHKVQAEVDQVVGDNALTIKHISRLVYLQACLRESLRFQGPINAITVTPKHDTVIGSRYAVSKGTNLHINLKGLHHDPKVWGNDSDVFRPERFLNGGYEALPPNSFKPFGNGMRGCIGRAFAEQEMMMISTLILQRFQVELADPSYHLALKNTLTVKPAGLGVKVRRRPGKSWLVGVAGGASKETANVAEPASKRPPSKSLNPPLLIIYGSNAGTCKSLAEDLETFVGSRFAVTVSTMDHATEHLPKDGHVVIITPSYEGKPADNAKKFVSWLESTSNSELLKGVQFAIYGAGNSEWAQTFHRVPKLLNEMMPKLGATRVHPAGYGDAKYDVVASWDEWKIKLVDKLLGRNAIPLVATELKIEIGKSETAAKLAGDEISFGFVRKNVVLCGKEVGCQKRHMEIELPDGSAYRTGDYIVVLPVNPMESIRRAMARFKLSPDDTISISGTHKSFLKSKVPLTAIELIGARVELAMPVSQRQLLRIADTTSSKKEQDIITSLSADDKYRSIVLEKRMSILDILDEFPSCELSLVQYIDMLRPLSPREYSISSSPLSQDQLPKPITASITFDVHEALAKSGNGRVFHGVASTYLANLEVGATIRCFVRATNAIFHLPKDPETPVIMVCAGTGIAPMRGFIEERAQIAHAGSRKLGKALLYFGCRDVDKDFIYCDELKAWENLGAIDLRMAFSQHGPENEPRYRYVADRMWNERAELASLFMDGAKIFVCGSASKLAKSSADVCIKIWREKHPEASEEDAFDWLQTQREDRYVSDVFD